MRLDDTAVAMAGSQGDRERLRTALVQCRLAIQAAHERTATSQLPTSGGAPLPATVQAKMEHSFGVGLSAVRVHHSPQISDMGALAATSGTDIHFAGGEYNPHSPAGQELLGHEIAHVVQQAEGRVRPGMQAKGGLALNDDVSLEREADELGAKAARSEAAEASPSRRELPRFTAPTVQGRVRTNGGTWHATTYEPTVYGRRVGCSINLEFEPIGALRGYRISLTQALRSEIRRADNTTRDAHAHDTSRALASDNPAHEGWVIDAGASADERAPEAAAERRRAVAAGEMAPSPPGMHDTPQTSPIYGDDNYRLSTSDRVVTNLGQASGTSLVHDPSDPTPLSLSDSPGRPLRPSESVTQTFETTAIVTDAPRSGPGSTPAGTYLGSVSWGYQGEHRPASSTPYQSRTVGSDVILASMGAPTAAFMSAARAWNAAQNEGPVHGGTCAGGVTPSSGSSGPVCSYDTANLPLVPASMETRDILRALVDRRSGGDAGELTAELHRRRVEVRLQRDLPGDAVVRLGSAREVTLRRGARSGNIALSGMTAADPIPWTIRCDGETESGNWSAPWARLDVVISFGTIDHTVSLDFPR